jgi:hypothetical protein
LGLALVFLALFITTASNDRQDGVFAEAGVRFGEAAHNKQATFGTFDNFDMLACSAQANQR